DYNIPIRLKGVSIMTKETLGSRIADARKKCKLTQEDLAAHLGVTAQAVSKWENDISCPDITLLPKLSSIFGISIDELLSGRKN
ncbi:MAG: helix-turn-helix domain-containing protein, partial [Firmicutes bacterium]|nr:helix-turn-helix domain-containing protein [Bacillota bacterium]